MPVHRSLPALALLLLLPGTLAAQRVVADISIGHGPLTGRVILGDPYPHYRTSVVVVRPDNRYRPGREVVVIHRPQRHGWYRHHGYRQVQVWYDADRQRYYERHDRNHPGLRAVVVYERGGRYYSESRAEASHRDDRSERHGGRNDERRARD